MYKIYHGSDQSILGDMISVRKDNTLRADFYVPAVRTEKYGKNSVRYLGPLIWKIVPSFYKNANNLLEFKRDIKKWTPKECPCRLCKVYVHDLGFINSSGNP